MLRTCIRPAHFCSWVACMGQIVPCVGMTWDTEQLWQFTRSCMIGYTKSVDSTSRQKLMRLDCDDDMDASPRSVLSR